MVADIGFVCTVIQCIYKFSFITLYAYMQILGHTGMHLHSYAHILIKKCAFRKIHAEKRSTDRAQQQHTVQGRPTFCNQLSKYLTLDKICLDWLIIKSTQKQFKNGYVLRPNYQHPFLKNSLTGYSYAFHIVFPQIMDLPSKTNTPRYSI